MRVVKWLTVRVYRSTSAGEGRARRCLVPSEEVRR